MKSVKYILFLLLPAILLVVFSGCSQFFDRSGYIQDMLDATYKGKFEEYARITDSTVGEIESDYNDFIQHETEVFLRFAGLSQDDVIPNDLMDQTAQTIKDLYSQVRYTVDESDRDGNVNIEIEPLDIYNALYPEFLSFNQTFREKNNDYEFQDYTDEEFTREYLSPLIRLLTEYAAAPTYRDPVTVTVNVALDNNGKYGISDESVAEIYNALIDYSIDNSSASTASDTVQETIFK